MLDAKPMADLPDDEKAKKPIGTSFLLGVLVGVISHEIVYQYANSQLWFSLAGVIPGLYILARSDQESVESDARYRIDDLTIARKLQGKILRTHFFLNHGRRQRISSRIRRCELMEFFLNTFQLSVARHCVDKERIALWSTIDINYSLTAEACVSVDSGSNRLLEIVCSRYFSLYKRIIYDRLSMILLLKGY